VCVCIHAGKIIPIRMLLSKYNLSPSFEAVHNMFSVKHFIYLAIIDEKNRRYNTKQEVMCIGARAYACFRVLYFVWCMFERMY